MKRIVVIVIVIAVIALIVPIIRFIDHQIIVNKITSMGEVLSKVDQEQLNKYFLPEARFNYDGNKMNYNSSKANIIQALNEKKIVIAKTAIYVDKFKSQGLLDADIIIIGWPKNAAKGTTELSMTAKLKKTGLLKWDIIELESKDKVFGYIFTDRNINFE